MNNRTKGEKIFDVINVIIVAILCISIIIPFMSIIATSLSSQAAVTAGTVTIIPHDITLEQYQYVFSNPQFWDSLKVSLFVTIFGTLLSLFLITPAAYTLSKKDLKYRKQIMLFFVFTMLFSGGIVPLYILIKGLGIYNTIWALILPSAMSVYNMILVKNYMEGLPSSVEESARIDGASEMQIFRRIILPLCKPVLATVGLFFIVGYWNSYFPGLMYISDPALQPLQTYLYQLQQLSGIIETLPPAQQELYANVSDAGIQAATIMAITVPILIVYPFLQKYFVKGIVVGSDK